MGKTNESEKKQLFAVDNQIFLNYHNTASNRWRLCEELPNGY